MALQNHIAFLGKNFFVRHLQNGKHKNAFHNPMQLETLIHFLNVLVLNAVNFHLKLHKCDYSAKELHSPVCTVHKSPATQYITPRELVVTHLIALSPSKFLFYVFHCFHLQTELPWKYPQQIRITILFRISEFKQVKGSLWSPI